MQMEHLVKRTIETLQNGGGGVVGNNEFVNKSTQSGWVTVFIFLLLWFLSLLLVPLFRQFGKNRTTDEGADTGKLGWGDRIVDAGRAARDGFLILLGIVLINMAGYGVNSGVETLLWIILGLLVIWYLQFLFFYNPFVDFLLLLGALTLSVINFALAFRNAPRSSN